MRLQRALLISTLVLGAVACGSDAPEAVTNDPPSSVERSAPAPDSDGTENDGMIEISGSITYLQRIALQPGGTATVTLQDVSLADAASTVIAEQVIELGDRQVPIPFELTADKSDLVERNTYSVRATITGPDGELWWTTETANPVDPALSSVDLGELVMVQV